jgi:hypothetical protein
MPIRDPSGVVNQLTLAMLGLSVALSRAAGSVTPLTAARRAVLSASRHTLALIPSTVPPE